MQTFMQIFHSKPLLQEADYRDPTNIQQKHQKQQAFEAELSANADRIATLISAGQNLITASKCSGGEDAVSHRLRALNDQWDTLVKTSTEKSHRLKEANKQKTFMASVKDLEFWLGEVITRYFMFDQRFYELFPFPLFRWKPC
jgi:hypothetical protein